MKDFQNDFLRPYVDPKSTFDKNKFIVLGCYRHTQSVAPDIDFFKSYFEFRVLNKGYFHTLNST